MFIKYEVDTHNRLTAVNLGYPGGLVSEETYTHADHTTSFTNFIYDPLHPTGSIYMHDSPLPQLLSRSSGLPRRLGPPCTSYSIHFFTQSFPNTCPCHCSLFWCSASRLLCHLFLISQLLTWTSVFCLHATHPSDHSRLCSLKCHLIFTRVMLCYYGPVSVSVRHKSVFYQKG